MNQLFDPQKILSLAASNDDRKKISLYLSEKIYVDLQKVCKDWNAPVSKVLELLIDEFLSNLRKANKK